MKESIIVLFFFSFGVLGGRLDLLPADWLGLVHEASNLAVYAMLAAVGMSLGFDSRAWRILRDLKGWVVLVPRRSSWGRSSAAWRHGPCWT